MRRNLHFFSRFCFLAFCCFQSTLVFGQNTDRPDLTGTYTGTLKFPSANLNGKATLSVEGDKFRLRGANGNEKIGRITAIKADGDNVSIALMFEEIPNKNQPFTHSMMTVRLRQTGKNFSFTSAPGEERRFLFEAVTENSVWETKKIADTGFAAQTGALCDNSASSKCGINFGFVAADRLENVSNQKTKPLAKSENNNFSVTNLKLEAPPENKLSNPAKENQAEIETQKKEQPSAAVEKSSPPLEVAPKTADSKPQDETSVNAFKQATDEMRRATAELKRAADEIKATTNELLRLRSESAAKTGAVKNVEAENATSKKSVSAAPLKSLPASNKTRRKTASATKPIETKPFPPNPGSTKPVMVNRAANKSGSKSKAVKLPSKKTPAKPAETKPSPNATPKPSPAGSPAPER